MTPHVAEVNTSTGEIVSHSGGFDLPTVETVVAQFAAIAEFQQTCHRLMVEGRDYGIIPGTKKPTLLKPGAQMVTKLLGLCDTYTVEAVQNLDKPFFAFTVHCWLTQLCDGKIVTQGLGYCNSMEAKYRWREMTRTCPNCHSAAIIKGKGEYGGGWVCFKKKGGCGSKWPDGTQSIEAQITGRVPNEDICDQVNTMLKIAKKRALVDAALSAGLLSDVFTEDLEESSNGLGPAVTVEPPDGGMVASNTLPPIAAASAVKFDGLLVPLGTLQRLEALRQKNGMALDDFLDMAEQKYGKPPRGLTVLEAEAFLGWLEKQAPGFEDGSTDPETEVAIPDEQVNDELIETVVPPATLPELLQRAEKMGFKSADLKKMWGIDEEPWGLHVPPLGVAWSALVEAFMEGVEA